MVDGPTGSGRSTVLRHVAAAATREGAVVLHAACSASERSLAFGVLHQLFDSAALDRGEAGRAARLLDEAAAHPAADPEGELSPRLARILHGLVRILLDVAARAPLLVGVDDIRYADDASMSFLPHLVRRLTVAPVLVVFTDDGVVVTGRSRWYAELVRQPYLRRIPLPPLTAGGVARLVRARLGDLVPAGLAAEVFAASGGSPLLAQALLDDLGDGGEGQGRVYSLAVLGCVHRNGPVAVRAARAVAVLGGPAVLGGAAEPGIDDGRSAPRHFAEPVSPDDIAALTGDDTEAVRAALAELEAAGLLRGTAFRHPRTAAVLADMAPEQRRELHRRAAAWHRERGVAAEVVARHLVQADQSTDPAGVGILLAAAESALQAGAAGTAIARLELAGRSACAEAQRVTIRARLAEIEWRLNPLTAARHLTALTAAGRLDQSDRLVLIRQLLWHGRVADAVTVLDGLRADAADPAAAGAVRDLELWLSCSYPALAGRRRSPAPRPVAGSGVGAYIDPWLRPAALLADALVRGRSRATAVRAEQVLRDLGVTRRTSWAEEAAMLALLVLVCADQSAVAAEWCDRLLAEAGDDAITWRAILSAARAEAAVRLGDHVAAVRHAEAALGLLPAPAWGAAVGFPLSSLILANTRMGRHDAATNHLRHALDSVAYGSRYGLRFLHARGNHYLATEHHHAALADFLSCGELMRDWGMDVAALAAWRINAAEAWLGLGNADQARQLVHDQLARPGGEGGRVRGLALRVLAAASPPKRRPSLLNEALDLFEGCGDRFEQARVLADLSDTYRSLDESRRGRMVFRRAWHMAKLCDAGPLSQQLLAIDGDLPGSVAALRPAGGAGSLTPSERRVASLAVLGYTNREIAGKLYITPSTVEQHLTRVYRKLSVKHRRELPVELGMELARTA